MAVWRRLDARFDPALDTHSAEQTFWVGGDSILRRLVDAGARGAEGGLAPEPRRARRQSRGERLHPVADGRHHQRDPEPEQDDAWMFHTPNLDVVKGVAEGRSEELNDVTGQPISSRLDPSAIWSVVSAALMAMAVSAAVPCWNRPTTSRVSAGFRLSKVAPAVPSHHSPAMKWRKVGASVAETLSLYHELGKRLSEDFPPLLLSATHAASPGRIWPPRGRTSTS